MLAVQCDALNQAFYWVNDTRSITFENNRYTPQPFVVQPPTSDASHPDVQLHLFQTHPLTSPLWQQGHACLQKENAQFTVTLQTVYKRNPKAAIDKHTYQVTAMHAEHTQLTLTLTMPHHLHELSVIDTYRPETYPHLFQSVTQGVT